MNKTRSVTNELADFVSNAQWADIPSNVRHEAKRSLVNYFAVALAGSSDPSIAAAISVYGRFSAGNQCRLVGRNERTDILNAAALNAMSANVYDFDDTHLPTIIHPSAPVAAALFALSEDVGLSGEDLLLAFVIGVEVECRLGIALASCHYERGWHITSTCGVFGAAAAVGRALGLDPQAIAWAFGHASAQSSGLVETLGTMSKSVSVGNASRNGILSAILAREGLTGPQNPIEGTRGLLNVMSDHPDPHALADAIGCKWALLSNTYKPYPCGVVLNPVIEACLDLTRNKDWSIADIVEIELTGHPLLRQRTDRPGVQTGREAQVSAQHSVAVALITGRAGLAEFSDTAAQDAEVRYLGSKVAFLDDPSFPVEAATITIALRSGEMRSRSIASAKGSLQIPLTDAELDEKFHVLSGYGRASDSAAQLLDLLWNLERVSDASTVMRAAQA